MPHLSEWQSALGVFVAIFASLFGARDSTGVVLPMLIVADIGAVAVFKQHARWDYLWRTLPPAGVGVVAAAIVMRHLDNDVFRPIIGGIILVLTVLQLVRLRWPSALGRVPHTPSAAWALACSPA